MLDHPGRHAADGRLAFDFESLPVLIQATPSRVWGRGTGTAHIAYDGGGAWWVDGIELSNPRAPGPNVALAASDPLFGEIRARLGQYRGEDIVSEIARALDVGPSPRSGAAHPIPSGGLP